MRGVGDETAEAFLGAAPLLEGSFDVREHRVEGDPEPPDLGPLVGRFDPAGEITGRDRSSGVADPREGTQADADEFKERASCVSDQYSQYVVVDDVKINGKLTLGEDVADLGGLRLAWLAWQEAEKNQKLGPVEGFTPEQRFFIGYGQGWCSSRTAELARTLAQTNPHSPERYRTNGVVSNLPQFQQAFGCKAGQPMVRQNQCRVW